LAAAQQENISHRMLIADRNFDFAGGQKTEEIKPRKSSSVKRLIPHFQNAKPCPATSPLLACRKINQSASENQGKLQKSI